MVKFLEEKVLFEATQGGYEQVRIPGIAVTPKGTVLAYCEARRSSSDYAAMDILMRRSTDNGETWGEAVLLVNGSRDGQTVNNPVMIADGDMIHFIYCTNYARAFYRKSSDEGVSWTEPTEITTVFNGFKPEYKWVVIATGPGHGIRLQNGRLLVPIWLSTSQNSVHSPSVVSTIYSDNRGVTWEHGEIVWDTPEICDPNETAAVALADGSVLLNMRTANERKKEAAFLPCRAIAISKDGAVGWTAPHLDLSLTDPACCGSMVRYVDRDGQWGGIVFSNIDHPHERENLVIRLSKDEGRSWPIRKTLCSGGAAYSDMAVCTDGLLLCFYEKLSVDAKYQYLTLARFNLEWLTDVENNESIGNCEMDGRANPAPTSCESCQE